MGGGGETFGHLGHLGPSQRRQRPGPFISTKTHVDWTVGFSLTNLSAGLIGHFGEESFMVRTVEYWVLSHVDIFDTSTRADLAPRPC